MPFSPGVEPLGYFFVADFLPGLKFGYTGVKLAKLPLFGFDVRRNSLRGEK